MTNSPNIVIVGATGTIGKEVLGLFAERNFPANQIVALASSNSIGQEISYGEEKIIKTQGLENFAFQKAGLVIFCTPAAVSKKYMGKALSANCRILALGDATSSANSLYVIPEINGALLLHNSNPIFLTPNPGAIILALVLQPFIKNTHITQAVVTLLQAVSGGGREAMDELFTQTRAVYMNAIMQKRHFAKQIAFNLIPHIGEFTKEGATEEEVSTLDQLQQIFKTTLPLSITCVQAPIFIGYAATIHLTLSQPLSLAEITRLLEQTSGISVVDHRRGEGYVTPVETAGEEAIFISRIRVLGNQVMFWITADNLKRGSALNLIQTAEKLLKQPILIDSNQKVVEKTDKKHFPKKSSVHG